VDTFFWYWELSALGDLDGFDWLISLALWYILDSLDDLVTLEDLAENNVLAVEVAKNDISLNY